MTKGDTIKHHTGIDCYDTTFEGFEQQQTTERVEILEEHGWLLSHRTPIRCVDGSVYHSYTFVCPLAPAWCASVADRPGSMVSIGRVGSGRRSIFFGGVNLDTYLRRKNRQLTKLQSR